jgi:glycyl-tRNA synthetase
VIVCVWVVGCSELNMLPSPIQLAGQDMIKKTLGDAVKEGTIANQTLAYFIGRTAMFLLKAGIKPEHMRFRQHLPTEMAHYACDCWDAEIEVSTGWMETVGIADRSAYDLTVHAEKTKVSLDAQDKLETPISVEVVALAKKAGALMGKDFRQDAPIVKTYLEKLSPADAKALQAEVEAAGTKEISIDGKTFTIKKEHAAFDIKTETRHMETYTPHVIEPSFGIDRVFTAVLEHSYYAREQDPEDKEKINRGVLALTPDVAPYKAIIMPLDQKVGAHGKYTAMVEDMRNQLSENAINYKVDDSGASVGKRYARNDELGIPLAITIDYVSIGQGEGDKEVEAALAGTVTIRERDSCLQIRVPASEAVDLVVKMTTRGMKWSEAQTLYSGKSPSSAAPEGSTQAQVEAYLKQHKISELLNECLNETLAARPANPLKHLSDLLAAKSN